MRLDKELGLQAQKKAEAHGFQVTARTIRFHKLQLDRAVEIDEVGAHGIHTHATARGQGGFILGAESGFKNQVRQFDGHRGLAFEKTTFHGLFEDLAQIEPLAIILDRDQKFLAVNPSVDADLSAPRFSDFFPLFDGLDAVIDGVIQKMDEDALGQQLAFTAEEHFIMLEDHLR